MSGWYLFHNKCAPFSWVKAQFRWLKPVKVKDTIFGDGYYSLQLNIISPEKVWIQQNCLQITSGEGIFTRHIWNRTLTARPNIKCETLELPDELTKRINSFGSGGFQQVNLSLLENSIEIEILDFPELIYKNSLPFKTEPITAIQSSIVGYGNTSQALFKDARFFITVEAPTPLFAQRINPDALDFNALKCESLSLVSATWESGNMEQTLTTGDNCPNIGIISEPRNRK